MDSSHLYISGIGTFLPPSVSAKEAVEDGRFEQKEFEECQYESILESNEESAPEMAIRAARVAVTRAGLRPEEILLVLYSNISSQGLDFWPVASYIQHVVLGDHSALALETRQMSNGCMANLELAAAYLIARPACKAALLTTGDKFSPPYCDRWRCDTGIVYADGGTAVVLSKIKGFARLLSIVTTSNPSLEKLHRGQSQPGSFSVPVDVRQRKREFLAEVGLDYMLLHIRAGLRASVDGALLESRTSLNQIVRFVLPNVGRILIEREYLAEFGIDERLTTWPWGRFIGHLGAGDQFAGFAHLVETGSLNSNDRCLLIGVGAGFTWTTAVVELIARPEWVSDLHVDV